MNTVGEMDGGSSSLGSKAVVDAVEGILVLVDIYCHPKTISKRDEKKSGKQ